jgi:hypothetical protein
MSNQFKIRNIHPEWKQIAMDSAVKRRQFHSKKGSINHWYDPKKGEYTDEYYGSLGQICFENIIKQIGLDKDSEFVPLYTSDISSLPEWDAKILDQTIEIKTIPPGIGKKRLLAKVSEFKNLDMYVGIKFWNDKEYSICGYITGNNLKRVEPRNFGFADAHWVFLDQLLPLGFTVNGNKVTL